MTRVAITAIWRLASWVGVPAAAPSGLHRYTVPGRDGDGGGDRIDQLEIVAEVA